MKREEYACQDVVKVGDYYAAESALRNALTCDAFPEELASASRAADRLADAAETLSRRLREAAR